MILFTSKLILRHLMLAIDSFSYQFSFTSFYLANPHIKTNFMFVNVDSFPFPFIIYLMLTIVFFYLSEISRNFKAMRLNPVYSKLRFKILKTYPPQQQKGRRNRNTPMGLQYKSRM